MRAFRTIGEKVKWLIQHEDFYLIWLLKRIFCGLFLPFKTLFRRRFLVRTVLWFVFSVGFSLIGTIINIIKFAIFNIPKVSNAPETISDKVKMSIYMDSKTGTFYTFSIVLAASILYPLFECFIKHEWHYTYLRVITIIVAILVLVFGGVFYSFLTIGGSPASYNVDRCNPDQWQLAFFTLAIFVAAYSYGLGLMKEDVIHPQIDDYSDKENKEVEALINKMSQSDSNEEGGIVL